MSEKFTIAKFIKQVNLRFQALDNLKDLIVDEVEERLEKFADTLPKVNDQVDQLGSKLKQELKAEMLEVKEEMLSHLADLQSLREELLNEVASIKDEFDFSLDEDTLGSVEKYLSELRLLDPDLFNDRVKMIDHMGKYIESVGEGGDWYKVWKALRGGTATKFTHE